MPLCPHTSLLLNYSACQGPHSTLFLLTGPVPQPLFLFFLLLPFSSPPEMKVLWTLPRCLNCSLWFSTVPPRPPPSPLYLCSSHSHNVLLSNGAQFLFPANGFRVNSPLYINEKTKSLKNREVFKNQFYFAVLTYNKLYLF